MFDQFIWEVLFLIFDKQIMFGQSFQKVLKVHFTISVIYIEKWF